MLYYIRGRRLEFYDDMLKRLNFSFCGWLLIWLKIDDGVFLDLIDRERKMVIWFW